MRWHPACGFGQLGKVPCILSLFRDAITDKPAAIHRTHIYSAARGESERMALGTMMRSAIKLWPLNGGNRLAIGEGIETVLAAVQIGAADPPAWAATVANNLAKLPVVVGVRRLVVLADNDETDTGQEAARELRRRWLAGGREVELRLPPFDDVKDFNDLLRRRT
jgi:hypothetical protein